MKALQDYYPENFAQCYGCGRENHEGHQIKTHWDGDETVSRYTPKEYHKAIPGFVYGGLLASIIDCHGTGSASLAIARDRGIELTEFNAPRCVTASLKVDYHKPTPLGPEDHLKYEYEVRIRIPSTSKAASLQRQAPSDQATKLLTYQATKPPSHQIPFFLYLSYKLNNQS